MIKGFVAVDTGTISTMGSKAIVKSKMISADLFCLDNYPKHLKKWNVMLLI